MRKLLFILAFIPLLIFGQGTQNLTVKRVKTDSLYVYKLESISSSGIVLVLDSVTGKVGKRPYSSGEGDSYWQEKAGVLSVKDTTKPADISIGDGYQRGQVAVDPSELFVGLRSFYSTKSSVDPQTFYPTMKSKIGRGSYYSGVVANSMGFCLLTEYSGGKISGIGFIGETMGNPGYLYGFSQHKSGGLLDFGHPDNLLGNFYIKSLVTDSTISADGGTSSDWNTAYAWGNHADAGYVANPMSATGDMIYNSLLDDGVQRLPIGSDGQVLKSITTNPGGTPITTPTWSNPDWTTSGSNIYRSGGFVGVNTTNPLSRFHTVGAVRSDTNITPLVLGGSAVSSSLTLKSTSATGSSDYIAFVTGGGTEVARFTTGGRLGIGTTNPSQILDIKSGGTTYLQVSAAYTRSFNSFLNASTGSYSWADRGGVGISSPGINLLAINNTTGVGIGTTAPAAKLHVNGGIMLDGTDTTGVGSSAKVGTIQYYNGNFYGLKAGTPPTWVQLNN